MPPDLNHMFLKIKNQSSYDSAHNFGYECRMSLGDQIRELREEKGLSQQALGKLVGVSQVTIDKIESGKTRRSKFLPDIAAVLGLPPSAILEASAAQSAGLPDEPFGPDELRPTNLRLIPIKVSGRAKAGEFIAIEDLGDFDEPETIYDIRDPRFPDARHLAFEVDGDSMNALKPRPIMDGDKVSALAYEDISERLPLRDGMIVVVERLRHGGLEREWSVKQLEIYEDRVEFHPRSTNPRFKPIVVKRDNNADDGTKVEIIAIVRRLVAEFNY